MRQRRMIQQQRERRKIRTRSKISGTAERPRLTVFRSLRYTSAQLINDAVGKTLWSGSTRAIKGSMNKSEAAFRLGEQAAQASLEKKITQVVFDRGSYRYHGRVKAVADGARKGGLKF